MSPKNQHVVPHPAGWAVKSEGIRRATSIHATKDSAIAAARAIAASNRSELFIHNRKGRIESRDNHAVPGTRHEAEAPSEPHTETTVPGFAARRTA